MDTVNAHLFGAIRRYADRTMQVRRDRSWTYRDVGCAAHGVALALRERGLGPGDRVAMLAENSPQWFHAYLGILAAGGIVVPRGEDTADADLRHILEHAGCRLAFAGSARAAERLPAGIDTIRLDDESFPDPVEMAGGDLDRYAGAARPEDLAVILYTSGTTGRPKGVMLEHRNLGHNIRVLPPLVKMEEGDLWVSVLPSWHTFEQTVELCGYSVGCVTVYSDRRRLRHDMQEHRPHFFASVPRIWETIYDAAHDKLRKRGPIVRALFRAVNGSTRLWRRGNPLGLPLHLLGQAIFYRRVREITGGRLKCAVSGGGALPSHVDEFFAHAGVKLLVGYGLTETAPVAALRDLEKNVLGTIGRPVPETEIKVGPEGTFLVRGPQVMRGYYKDEELTRTVLSEDGWFDTGDLGRITDAGDLVFVGRKKETIVLSGGENIEPGPIEDRILHAACIHQVMLVGQDRKTIGALVVPENGATEEAVRAELQLRTGPPAGFRTFEAVHRFALVEEPFTTENGLLTPTLKLRRNDIAERYASVIDGLYE